MEPLFELARDWGSKPIAMQESILTATSIVKEFSGVRVLDDINLQVFPGEVFGIIGENGAGKSTLIKIFSGIYQATSGALALEGQSIEVKNPIMAKKLGIATVPQERSVSTCVPRMPMRQARTSHATPTSTGAAKATARWRPRSRSEGLMAK